MRPTSGIDYGTGPVAGSLRSPIDLYPRVGDDRWSDLAVSRATWAFLALGVTIRLVRLLLFHPLWGDECFVAANLIGRGYGDLLRPLDYQQVVPILFLWAERTVVKLLGFSEWSLRLFPEACGLVGLFVFRHLASRLMKGMPLLMAVAILAVAINPIRHSNEAKPYAADFLASTILLALFVEWWRRPDRPGWIWALTAATPLAIGLSFPSVFVLGGIGLAMLGRVWRGREPAVVAAFLAFGATTFVGFGANLALHRGPGSLEVKAYMDHYWSGMFPPLSDPVRLVVWLIRAHSGHLFAYPTGGANGGSLLTFVMVLVGVVDFVRRGRGAIVVAFAAPLGLALVASGARAYPYGESERMMQFEGPMVCLLAGYGLDRAIGRIRRPGSYRKLAAFALVSFAGLGVGLMGWDLLEPAKTRYDLRAREFARWFWLEAGRDAELACARVDLGLDFEGGPPHHGRSADYLVYQEIYSSRRRLERPIDWARLSNGHPLRCVLYDGVPVDSPLFEAWMARMARHYRLARVETYRVNAGTTPRSVSYEDHVAVLEFAPIGAPVDPVDIAREAVAEQSRPGRASLSLPGR